MRSLDKARLWRGCSLRVRATLALTAGLAVAGGSAFGVAAASAKGQGTPLVVWYDAARAAYVKEYKQTHPGANIKWVLYSGDNNGDGTLQSKFALYNRVGWKPGVSPDVVFDEENYEAGWLGKPPFNDLLDLSSYIPKSVWSQDEGLGDCLINGKLLCLRNDNAANVLWVDTKLWSQFFPGRRPRRPGHSTRQTASRWSRTTPATTSASSVSPGTPRRICGATNARSTTPSATPRCLIIRARRTARRSRG